jgi:hypothetical protein
MSTTLLIAILGPGSFALDAVRTKGNPHGTR